MAKEAFNRIKSIFCGPLEKELRKRLVKCFVWSVVVYGGRRKNNDGTDKEEEKKLAGSLAKKELPAEGCSRRYGKWE